MMHPYLKHRSVLVLAVLFTVWLLLTQINSAGGLSRSLDRLWYLLCFVFPAFLVGIVLHEWAHAYAAWKLGDPTGRMAGRLTLNPARHLDPLGTVMMFVAGFGWANPVPINPYNFRNRTRDMAFAAGAGPAMNLLISLVSIGAIRLLYLYMGWFASRGTGAPYVESFLLELAMINALLAVFNLLPVHPLDGHHFLQALLSPAAYATYEQNKVLVSFVGLLLLVNRFFDPLFQAVQQGVWLACTARLGGGV